MLTPKQIKELRRRRDEAAPVHGVALAQVKDYLPGDGATTEARIADLLSPLVGPPGQVAWAGTIRRQWWPTLLRIAERHEEEEEEARRVG